MNAPLFGQIVTEITDGGMLCLGRILNISHYVLNTSGLPGEMVEFGCHLGRTAVLMSVLSIKPIRLYDSFQGLPDRMDQDAGSLDHFKRGALAVSREETLRLIDRFSAGAPISVYKSWFDQIEDKILPLSICFAHLDGDLYTSIRDSLGLVYPLLVRGGVCIIDDYGWSGTAGVKIAADEFMADKLEKVQPLSTGNPDGFQGVIIKI